MPYEIKPSGSGYKVTEKSTGAHPGKTFSEKPQTRAKALAQLRAIMVHTKAKGK